jgi:hypothetical protein
MGRDRRVATRIEVLSVRIAIGLRHERANALEQNDTDTARLQATLNCCDIRSARAGTDAEPPIIAAGLEDDDLGSARDRRSEPRQHAARGIARHPRILDARVVALRLEHRLKLGGKGSTRLDATGMLAASLAVGIARAQRNDVDLLRDDLATGQHEHTEDRGGD